MGGQKEVLIAMNISHFNNRGHTMGEELVLSTIKDTIKIKVIPILGAVLVIPIVNAFCLDLALKVFRISLDISKWELYFASLVATIIISILWKK
ncbi:MAG: hypothetical protein AMQ74_01682 [Candidatus Methanofastidiosum methylothiophilum]|uniref:Uncharacterized protein n=1 Tax=Candidatus Methanofastidiosum methylothiophilum TaxID=1705564 RepID=A0A150IRA6_9EURY|nr:MAG: hypothetical protein AMQ74_01682 [Candidatus Methanofastidiosum methylthiophilus]